MVLFPLFISRVYNTGSSYISNPLRVIYPYIQVTKEKSEYNQFVPNASSGPTVFSSLSLLEAFFVFERVRQNNK